MFKNTPYSYGWISIAAHWLTALLVIVLYILGSWMEDLDYYSPWYQTAPEVHKSLGVLLALLIALRLVWKLLNSNPMPLGGLLEKKLALVAHVLMYLLLLLIFVSGYLISTADGQAIEVFNWFKVPALAAAISNQEDVAGEVHEFVANSLMWLVLLHALAALYHHYVYKDQTLVRILKPRSIHEEEK